MTTFITTVTNKRGDTSVLGEHTPDTEHPDATDKLLVLGMLASLTLTFDDGSALTYTKVG